MITEKIKESFYDKIEEIKKLSKIQDVINFISSLRIYTEEYIKLCTFFSRKNWLVDRINSYMVYSGKMVRSSFFYLFLIGFLRKRNDFDLYDFSFWDRVFRLGAIFELVHSATLVHDDILDNARKRRAKDAVHIKFGIDGAIIFGDILIISTLNQAYEIEPFYSKVLMEALENMCLGEVLQYQNRYNINISEEEYFDILLLKTGVLFGAIAKIATSMFYQSYSLEKVYNIFSSYGVAFQIIDDYLDYHQDRKILRKDSNNDLLSGRVTYPLILFVAPLSNLEREKLRRMWLKSPSTFVKFLRSKISVNKDIQRYCLQKAEEIMNMELLRDFLDEVDFDPLLKEALEKFLFSLIYRDY